MQPIPQRERQHEPTPADGPANQQRPVAPSHQELAEENQVACGTSEPDLSEQGDFDWGDGGDSAIGTPYFEYVQKWRNAFYVHRLPSTLFNPSEQTNGATDH